MRLMCKDHFSVVLRDLQICISLEYSKWNECRTSSMKKEKIHKCDKIKGKKKSKKLHGSIS